MILAALLLMQYSPETEAVQNRSRQRAAEKRAEAVEARKAEQQAQKVDKPLPLPPEIAAKFQACLDAGANDPDAGVRFAEAWRIDGGSYHARECIGFALARAERWPAALVAFEQAADEAERSGAATESARLWAQAGNAALAGQDAAKARTDFDAALARGMPDGLAKGEIYLDRARALVALGDQPGARIDLDKALELAPQDPLAWLLSATLARRMNEMSVAQRHIAEAVKLSPDDASVALEEGNIAILADQDDIARSAWERAVKIAPDSGAGKAATANLAELATSAKAAKAP
jgi:tetratricopeptide (TPR) repeat protein